MKGHNRVKAFIDDKPIPIVFRSKCHAFDFLREECPYFFKVGRATVATVWAGVVVRLRRPKPKFTFTEAVFDLKGGR